MQRNSNGFRFSMPFFVALVLLLSVYTYKFGSILNPTTKVDIRTLSLNGSRVLGIQSSSMGTKSIIEKKVVTNADGTTAEIYTNTQEQNRVIKVVNYDMYGVKVNDTGLNNIKDSNNQVLNNKTPQAPRLVPVKQYPNAFYGLVVNLYDVFLLFIK